MQHAAQTRCGQEVIDCVQGLGLTLYFMICCLRNGLSEAALLSAGWRFARERGKVSQLLSPAKAELGCTMPC